MELKILIKRHLFYIKCKTDPQLITLENYNFALNFTKVCKFYEFITFAYKTIIKKNVIIQLFIDGHYTLFRLFSPLKYE